ncbi:hypothetical protein [Thioalkalivibrio sp. HK1]|uniref:hypothetical protein n=1 Tax=Thioalkalivibrio sp. HK1 TaxID=1469245 RepID=UPI0004724CA5|nr:hypothetical protein [Thioalkalivibrio sp. HK1]
MPRSEAATVQNIVRDVLPLAMFRQLWTGNYYKVLPISFQEFELSTMLPAMFYLFRYGERRGKGGFLKAFAPEGIEAGNLKKAVTVDRIVDAMLEKGDSAFEGFDDDDNDTEKAILGDLILAHCLQNRRHEPGRDKQIQRALPAHYLSSWIDLPQASAHLRNVPEMMVGVLADQQGQWLERGSSRTSKSSEKANESAFSIGAGCENNPLLRAFNQGIEIKGLWNDRVSDRFDENENSVGLDQLLMIRLAQQIGGAPAPSGSTEGSRNIPNQRPISQRSCEDFSKDIASFLFHYSDPLPRYTLVGMLESSMAIGLTTIMTGAVDAVLHWEEEGRIPKYEEQKPAELFIDCSIGVDGKIRDAAERSMDQLMRRVAHFPAVLMTLRLLDYQVASNQNIKGLDILTRPYSTQWLNLLGDILHCRHDQAELVHQLIEEKSEALLSALHDRSLHNEYAEAKSILSDDERRKNQANPILRLGRGLTSLMGWHSCHRHLMEMVDSCLFIDRPHGIAKKRKTSRGGTRRDVRSMILSDSALEYLVHLQVLFDEKKSDRPEISLQNFIERIRKRYGFHIDRSPTGMNISNTILQSNRAELERRLRDLGLLIGVNDAQSMKRLRPRFEAKGFYR